MVRMRKSVPATRTIYHLKPGQTLQNTTVSERSLALIVPKSEFERFNDYASESRQAALLAEREAKRLAYLKEASYNMTKSWKDTIHNIQKRRRDEMLSQKKVEEAERVKFLKEMAAKNAEERAELVKHAKELILYRNPQCRLINRALFSSECLRELNEQVKFMDSQRGLQKKYDERYAESVLKDIEKFHEEEKERKRAKLKKIMDHHAELEKQIESNRKELEKIEGSMRKVESKDLQNMNKEIEDMKNNDLEEALKKKESLNKMFLQAIEERRKHEQQIAEEDKLQEKSVKIYRDMKYEIEKLAKEKTKIQRQERARKIEIVAKRLGESVKKRVKAAESREAAKKEEADKQLEEKRKTEELERLEERRAKKETIQRQMKTAEQEQEKRKKEEQDLKVWETLQRYKRADYDKEWNLQHLADERKKKIGYAAVLRRQMAEKEAERRKAQIEADDSVEVKEMINKANEKVLAYGERVLQESRGLRPIFPIEKAIEKFKRDVGLIPPFRREQDSEAPIVQKKKNQGRRAVCPPLPNDENTLYLG